MNTQVEVAGVKFKNPLIAASGTFGFGREYNKFYNIGEAYGGVSTKGLTLKPRLGNDAPRIAETPSGMLNSVGLQNVGVESFIEKDLEFLLSTGTVVIANAAGSTVQDYVDIVKILSASKVHMIELNISCPNVKQGGMAFGVYPETVLEVTKSVRKVCKKPLIVKLSPNVASIAENARAAVKGGADAISLINTLSGMAIDYKTKRPILANVSGGLSGPAVKPVALKMVYDCYKAVGDSIDIIGMGGITTGSDVLEFMLAGSRAVQIGTANIYDPMAGLTIKNELTFIAESCKINNISDYTGALEV